MKKTEHTLKQVIEAQTRYLPDSLPKQWLLFILALPPEQTAHFRHKETGQWCLPYMPQNWQPETWIKTIPDPSGVLMERLPMNERPEFFALFMRDAVAHERNAATVKGWDYGQGAVRVLLAINAKLKTAGDSPSGKERLERWRGIILSNMEEARALAVLAAKQNKPASTTAVYFSRN